MKRPSLSRRLLWGNLAVVAVGAATLFVTARLLGPQTVRVPGGGHRAALRLERDEHQPGRRRPGPGDRLGQQARLIEAELNARLRHSLTVALAAAVAAGGVAAVVGASLVSRRVLGPLDRMRTAVRRMARGTTTNGCPSRRTGNWPTWPAT